MPSELHVHFLPSLTSPDELAGGVVVVIDVLRASTTICAALAAAAQAVIPCLEIDEALRMAAQFATRTEVVVGGERKGLPIDGFDLGNSPADYTPQRVAGKTVIFTTTNGTQAMSQCCRARRVLIGAFVDLSAVARILASIDGISPTVHLLCAGTRGAITAEDILCAGALAARCHCDRHLNDQAELAMQAWLRLAVPFDRQPPVADLTEYLTQHSTGGRDVASLGFQADIRFASQIDLFDFAPELDIQNWRIVRAE